MRVLINGGDGLVPDLVRAIVSEAGDYEVVSSGWRSMNGLLEAVRRTDPSVVIVIAEEVDGLVGPLGPLIEIAERTAVVVVAADGRQHFLLVPFGETSRSTLLRALDYASGTSLHPQD
jgi:hypothetical protein